MAERLDEQFGFIFKFIDAVFSGILKGRKQAIMKAAQKDPEFQQIVQNVEKAKLDLEQWVEKKRQRDPEWAEIQDDLHRIIAKYHK